MASTARTRPKDGNKPFQPTEEHRKTVYQMTAYGISQNDICSVLDITVPTLHKYFRREIDTAFPLVNAKIANGLFLNATEKMNVTAQIFWLKTRAKWIEARPDDSKNEERELTIKVIGGLPE